MTRVNTFLLSTLLLSQWAIPSHLALAQILDKSASAENLPSAPQPQSIQKSTLLGASPEAPLALVAGFPREAGSQTASSASPQTAPPDLAPGSAIRLTRTQAEQLALKNNPRISVGHLLGLAQH